MSVLLEALKKAEQSRPVTQISHAGFAQLIRPDEVHAFPFKWFLLLGVILGIGLVLVTFSEKQFHSEEITTQTLQAPKPSLTPPIMVKARENKMTPPAKESEKSDFQMSIARVSKTETMKTSVTSSVKTSSIKIEPATSNTRDSNTQKKLSLLMENRLYDAALERIIALLTNDPTDTLAQLYLLKLNPHIHTEKFEALLNTLLKVNPKASHLYFAKGNILAKKGDWRQAYDAFHQAALLDQQNADILFNLAVSMDQLGQYKDAYHYYTRALSLSFKVQASFSKTLVQSRLKALQSKI